MSTQAHPSPERGSVTAVLNGIQHSDAKTPAAGIHLMLAPQYPSRGVISGVLKATLGGHVCLRTTCQVQSGLMSTLTAEKLLGRGDMLSLDVSQAPWLTPEERRRILAGK